MKQVFANSYLELKQLYPNVFAIRQDQSGKWTGLIEENKHEANVSSRN